MSAWDGIEFDDPYELAPVEPQNPGRGDKSEVQELREELAGLKAQLAEKLDWAEEIAASEHRTAAAAVAEREVKAVAAAKDPDTLKELASITTEADLIKFMQERGYTGGAHL